MKYVDNLGTEVEVICEARVLGTNHVNVIYKIGNDNVMRSKTEFDKLYKSKEQKNEIYLIQLFEDNIIVSTVANKKFDIDRIINGLDYNIVAEHSDKIKMALETLKVYADHYRRVSAVITNLIRVEASKIEVG